MITLDSTLRIPAHVMATTVDGDTVLLDTRTNQYFSLKQTGSDIWSLIREGKTLRQMHVAMLEKYQIEPAVLERDILEVANNLLQRQLVEISG